MITNATSQAARFLGYEMRTQHADAKITAGRRSVNARIGLFVPRDVIRQRCARYMGKGKPAARVVVLANKVNRRMAEHDPGCGRWWRSSTRSSEACWAVTA